jgi:hypothetical protein
MFCAEGLDDRCFGAGPTDEALDETRLPDALVTEHDERSARSRR